MERSTEEVRSVVRGAVHRLVMAAAPSTNGPVAIRHQRARGGAKRSLAQRERTPLRLAAVNEKGDVLATES